MIFLLSGALCFTLGFLVGVVWAFGKSDYSGEDPWKRP